MGTSEGQNQKSWDIQATEVLELANDAGIRLDKLAAGYHSAFYALETFQQRFTGCQRVAAIHQQLRFHSYYSMNRQI